MIALRESHGDYFLCEPVYSSHECKQSFSQSENEILRVIRKWNAKIRTIETLWIFYASKGYVFKKRIDIRTNYA